MICVVVEVCVYVCDLCGRVEVCVFTEAGCGCVDDLWEGAVGSNVEGSGGRCGWYNDPMVPSPTELGYVVELYGFQPVLKTRDLVAELQVHFG